MRPGLRFERFSAMTRAKDYEFNVVPPSVPLLISLYLQPEEVEMAIETGGRSLQSHAMRALVETLTTYVDLPTQKTDESV